MYTLGLLFGMDRIILAAHTQVTTHSRLHF